MWQFERYMIFEYGDEWDGCGAAGGLNDCSRSYDDLQEAIAVFERDVKAMPKHAFIWDRITSQVVYEKEEKSVGGR